MPRLVETALNQPSSNLHKMKHRFIASLLVNWASSSCGWSLSCQRNQASTSPLHYATSNVGDQAVTLPKSFEKLTSLSLDDCHNRRDKNVQIYCDLDGVLVDFAHGIQKIFDRAPEEIPKPTMWEGVTSVDSFYENLPWTCDGKQLWRAIQPLSPDILTGVPCYVNSRREKVNWCRRELLAASPSRHRRFHVHHVDKAAYNGHDHVSVNGNEYFRPNTDSDDARIINVITCWAKNKHYESRPGA